MGWIDPMELVHPATVARRAAELSLRMRILDILQHRLEGGYAVCFVIESPDVIRPGIGPVVCQGFDLTPAGLKEAMEWLDSRTYSN